MIIPSTSLTLRLTAKLAKAAKVTLAKAEDPPEPSPEDWYGNLIYLDGRKCLLLTHAGTLFTIFEADIRVADIRPIQEVVPRLIRRELEAEGLPTDAFGPLESEGAVIAKTADRSVVGVMVDMAFELEWSIADKGGLANSDSGDINRWLHRRLNLVHRGVLPIEMVQERLGIPVVRPRPRGYRSYKPSDSASGTRPI